MNQIETRLGYRLARVVADKEFISLGIYAHRRTKQWFDSARARYLLAETSNSGAVAIFGSSASLRRGNGRLTMAV
jgi:hypothetical protein